ncbi:MAG: phosphatidylserine synthase, partial [Clostridia bacterium]|nr:phosphatidylserine synthase [Clostridia bacterium]
VSALIGICLSAAGYPFYGGVICLWISGICDAFDGTIAKTRKNRTEEDKLFGERIDSLSDLIAFGIAPVMIGFGMGMHEWYYIVVFCIFVLCALIRLAYFDVTEQIRLRDPNCGRRTSYEGLPVTNAAVAIPVFYLVAIMFRNLEGLAGTLTPKLIMAAGYVIVAFLYVFRFRMFKAGVKGLLIAIFIVVALCVSLLLVNIFVFGGIA